MLHTRLDKFRISFICFLFIVSNVINHCCVLRFQIQCAKAGARNVVVYETIVPRSGDAYTAMGEVSAVSAGESGVITKTVDIGPLSPVGVMMEDVTIGSVENGDFDIAYVVNSTSVDYCAVNAEDVWEGWGPSGLDALVEMGAIMESWRHYF